MSKKIKVCDDQFNIRIPQGYREKIRIHAMKRNMTLKEWFVSIIADAIRRDEEYNK